MKRQLLESYCKEHLNIKQSVHDFTEMGKDVIIFFDYSEEYVYQETVTVSLLEIVSFVYSKSFF